MVTVWKCLWGPVGLCWTRDLKRAVCWGRGQYVSLSWSWSWSGSSSCGGAEVTEGEIGVAAGEVLGTEWEVSFVGVRRWRLRGGICCFAVDEIRCCLIGDVG